MIVIPATADVRHQRTSVLLANIKTSQSCLNAMDISLGSAHSSADHSVCPSCTQSFIHALIGMDDRRSITHLESIIRKASIECNTAMNDNLSGGASDYPVFLLEFVPLPVSMRVAGPGFHRHQSTMCLALLFSCPCLFAFSSLVFAATIHKEIKTN